MSNTTVVDDLYAQADALHDRLAAMPVTAANAHLRAEMEAELAALDAEAAAARRHERMVAREIHQAADRLLARHAGCEVAPVDEYMRAVDTADEGRAFMRAGVDGGQCKRMWLYEATTPETGQTALWVVDTKGGRKLCALAKKFGLSLRWVDHREAPVTVVA